MEQEEPLFLREYIPEDEVSLLMVINAANTAADAIDIPVTAANTALAPTVPIAKPPLIFLNA